MAPLSENYSEAAAAFLAAFGLGDSRRFAFLAAFFLPK
jgi:hypothetical protein